MLCDEITRVVTRYLESGIKGVASSDKLLLSYPRFKSKATLGDRSFTCAAPKLWNALPFEIRSASTVSIFKTKLKTHLFRHAFLS